MAKMVLEKGRAKQPRRSLDKPSAWELGGLSFKEFGKRLWTSMDSNHDDTFGRAAELAFWFFFSVFPGLVFLITVLGMVAGKNPGMQDTLYSYIAETMPPSAWQLMQHTLSEITKHAGGWKLLFGLLLALWSGSSGISSLMTVLNFAYHVEDRRSFFKSRLVMAPLLTIALAALMMTAMAIILFGGLAAAWVGHHGLGAIAVWSWRIAQYAIALFFVVLGFALLYYWAPDVKKQKWYWLTPGSVIGVALWIAASAGFRVYLHFANTYNATYGSLGAVMILIMWFYITSLALLIGAEINAEIEQAAAENGRADAKLKGELEAPAA
jgi:membrane protein